MERWFGSTGLSEKSIIEVSGVVPLEELKDRGELSESSKDCTDDEEELLI